MWADRERTAQVSCLDDGEIVIAQVIERSNRHP
jgi:hypothetical protein